MLLLKKHVFLLLAFFIVSVFGCATDRDLSKVRQDLKRKIFVLQEENKESDKSLRKGQADICADMTDLRDDVQKFRGIVEELNRDAQTDRKAKSADEDIRKKLSVSFLLFGKSSYY